MASPRDERRPPGGPFTLPPIAQMTRDMPQDKSPKHNSVPHEMMRDSGMWSMQSPSKHSSTISSAAYSTMSSNHGLQLQTILNSDDSPHRFSSTSAASGNTPASARMSHQSHPLPALNRSITNDHNPRASIDANNTFFIDSRRSSIDSRSNVNFDSLNINPASPYDTHNPSHRASEASLASSFQHQAPTSNPIPPPPPKSATAGPSGPTPRRPLTSGGAAPRRAPAIAPNPRQPGVNPTASQPTKGHAWAFPDTKEEDEMADSLTPDSSRQNSLASGNTGHLESFGLRHAPSNHTLPHKTMTSLSGPDILAGNYSRTPELRVSHKLAERKRRSEMKDLFDSLNRILPNSPGNKSSKWEVLSKAIEYIEALKHSHVQAHHDNERLRRELDQNKVTAEDNAAMNHEITVMYQQICRLDPNGHKVFGQRTAQFVEQERQQPSQQHRNAGHQPYAPMQGVEYGYDRR
ncbi:MAG: hypothetical protein Q9162_002868 [Coniocarpon cinnabarinum]